MVKTKIDKKLKINNTKRQEKQENLLDLNDFIL